VQCDVDVLGSASMAVEAEVILAAATALGDLGFDGLVVRLNSRPLLARLVRSCGVADDHLGAAVVAIDKLDKTDAGTIRGELAANGVPDAAAAALLDLHARSRTADGAALLREVEERVGAAGAASVAELREVLALTPPLPSGRVAFDPFLARGLDYYTGPIFEIAADGIPFSLAGGGRFDDLIERLSGVKVPACGFSIGFERVFTLMEERNMFGEQSRAADVLIVLPTQEATRDALALAAELRGDGVRVDVFPHATKVAAQYELADRKRIPYAVIADPDKLRDGTVEVRDLHARRNESVGRAELAQWILTHV
jgi:histidyl-tRNA synthetase